MVNVCFLIGKIVSEIEFDFILNSKNISIVIFLLELNNKTVVSVKGYNEIADFCYSKLDIGDNIMVYGDIDNKMEIIIEEIILLDLPEGRSFW